MKNRKLITIERIFKNGFVNFGRNIWLAIAAIAMMAVTLTILLFGLVTNITFTHTINDLTSHITLSAYLKDDITPQQRDKFISDLKKQPQVKSVDYTSKEDALKQYKQTNIDNPVLLGAIAETGNILPASVEIKPYDPNDLQQIQDFLDKPAQQALQSGPSSYKNNQDRKAAIDQIAKATRIFKQAGAAGIIIFALVSILIIFNTIRMAIFNRRDELVIMRLLGATPAYIRGPFIVETVLYGIVAAGLSLTVCYTLFKVSSSVLKASSLGLLDIDYASNYFTHHLPIILTGQIAMGIIIGAASSALATRRYLRLK
jgi:cell division transport system permease protein